MMVGPLSWGELGVLHGGSSSCVIFTVSTQWVRGIYDLGMLDFGSDLLLYKIMKWDSIEVFIIKKLPVTFLKDLS